MTNSRIQMYPRQWKKEKKAKKVNFSEICLLRLTLSEASWHTELWNYLPVNASKLNLCVKEIIFTTPSMRANTRNLKEEERCVIPCQSFTWNKHQSKIYFWGEKRCNRMGEQKRKFLAILSNCYSSLSTIISILGNCARPSTITSLFT